MFGFAGPECIGPKLVKGTVGHIGWVTILAMCIIGKRALMSIRVNEAGALVDFLGAWGICIEIEALPSYGSMRGKRGGCHAVRHNVTVPPNHGHIIAVRYKSHGR